ncbi:hypothetical protein DFJ74DRAFT_683189 [Hyaloraphidium curvatum]|nr:hypothetical protein DFJ74DRAFT_683189 [Hyaloraphidium curvatum]
MAEYHGTYLLHMAHEEATIEKHMMEHFTDAELVQHQIGIMGEMSPDTLLLWFRYIVPARRTAENAAVLAAFRAAAPPAVYEAAIKVIAEEIGQDRTQELEKAVAAVEAPAA